jgi:hypothetical protein
MNEANAALGTRDQSNPKPEPCKKGCNNSDNVAAVVIGLYLVVHIAVLSLIALTVWLKSDCSSWFLFRPLHLPCPEKMSPAKLAAFRSLLISGCMAGLGGAVYALRKFYLTYAYGYDNKDGCKEYLKMQEIPRYVLLPLASVILGPITMALAWAGAITFTGSAAGKQMPILTLVGFSFLMGFSYHDTLKGLQTLSSKIVDLISATRKNEDKGKKGKESDSLVKAARA